MVHFNECPLCSSSKISLFLKCKDHFLSKEDFDLFRCSACDFVFTQDLPDEQGIGRYYESYDYLSHNYTAKGFINKIYFLVRRIMLRRKRAIIKDATGLKRGSLLDIGSGTGHFSGSMKEVGWLVTGVEPNKKARDYSIRRYGVNIIDPEHISELLTGSFDCITLWHVLEHLQEPFKYAVDINRLLKPDGICVVALPNNNAFDAVFFKEFWAAYDVPRHFWHFNPSTFELFSKKTGFEITGIKSLPFDVFYISILSARYKGSDIPLIFVIVRSLWFAIKSVFQKEKSSSLIYFLKKSSNQ